MQPNVVPETLHAHTHSRSLTYPSQHMWPHSTRAKQTNAAHNVEKSTTINSILIRKSLRTQSLQPVKTELIVSCVAFVNKCSQHASHRAVRIRIAAAERAELFVCTDATDIQVNKWHLRTVAMDYLACNLDVCAVFTAHNSSLVAIWLWYTAQTCLAGTEKTKTHRLLSMFGAAAIISASFSGSPVCVAPSAFHTMALRLFAIRPMRNCIELPSGCLCYRWFTIVPTNKCRKR